MSFTAKIQTIVDLALPYARMKVRHEGGELLALSINQIKDYSVDYTAAALAIRTLIGLQKGNKLFGDEFLMLKSKKPQTRASEKYTVFSDMSPPMDQND